MKRGTLILLSVLLWAGTANADRWDQHKGDCDRVMKTWRTQTIGQLKNCAMIWEMYRNVKKISDADRTLAREVFEKIYQNGDRRAAQMAKSGLKRLGYLPRKLRRGDGSTKDAPAPHQVAVHEGFEEPPPPPPPEDDDPIQPQVDPRAAKRAYKRGRVSFKRGEFQKALSDFLIAADGDPTDARPQYMLAMSYMKLQQPKNAIRSLITMKAINSELAHQLLQEAASERTFRQISGSAAFKDLTGLANVQILNGAGKAGLENIKNYKVELEKQGLPVTLGIDRNERTSNFIYTKPGFERQGEDIRRQLRLGLVHKRSIDWPSEYDVILVHGQPKKTKWVDDEAEKSGNGDKDKKKAEEAAAEKAKADENAAKAAMKRKIQVLKMLQEMEAEDATGAAADANPANGILPP